MSHRGVGPPDIPPAHRRARPPTSGSLAVELHGTVVGQLEGDAATCDFVPSSEGMARFGVSSPALSVAIPLTRSQASRAFANRLRLANPPGPCESRANATGTDVSGDDDPITRNSLTTT